MLVLYFSIQPLPQEGGFTHPKEDSLRYELSREEWDDITEARETEQARLLERSVPRLIETLKNH